MNRRQLFRSLIYAPLIAPLAALQTYPKYHTVRVNISGDLLTEIDFERKISEAFIKAAQKGAFADIIA